MPAARFSRRRRHIRRHVVELVRLAWPVVLTRTGILTMVLADTVMVARYSTLEVAYLGLAIYADHGSPERMLQQWVVVAKRAFYALQSKAKYLDICCCRVRV